jgi:hypothetical protein
MLIAFIGVEGGGRNTYYMVTWTWSKKKKVVAYEISAKNERHKMTNLTTIIVSSTNPSRLNLT